MNKEKIALSLCFCLIVALSGFSVSLYFETKGVESEISDLQAKIDSLQAVLSLENITFYNSSGLKVNITIGNSGTADAKIIYVYNGTSSANLAKTTATVTYNPTTQKVVANGSLTITLSPFTWTTGTTYYFKVVTDAGQSLPFNGEAMESFVSSIYIYQTTFQGASGATNNTILLNIQNTGTKTVTVGLVKVNNVVMGFTSSPSPCKLTPSATGTITVYMGTYGWVSGNPYDINLYDTSGNGVGSTTWTPP